MAAAALFAAFSVAFPSSSFLVYITPPSPRLLHSAWPDFLWQVKNLSLFVTIEAVITVKFCISLSKPHWRIVFHFQKAVITQLQGQRTMHVFNRMLANRTEIPEISSSCNDSSLPITSLRLQAGSNWGPSDIGTMVFGCVASVLGMLTLWMTYWLWVRQSSIAMESGITPTLHLSH